MPTAPFVVIHQGKSLSVICSALQWLKDAEAKDVEENASLHDESRGRYDSPSARTITFRRNRKESASVPFSKQLTVL